MMWMVRVALERPYTFIVLALFILIVGPLAALTTATDIFPNIGVPVIGVAWSYTMTSIGVLFVPYMIYCLHTVGVRLPDLLGVLRTPLVGLNAQSNTGRCSSLRPGAPSMVSFSSM